MNKTKSFNISKRMIWNAYKRVKANKGSAGVDNVSIAEFESNLKDNLYILWNRMASGSYFPKPVQQVLIPKKTGGKRPLGIPTVADRIAQMVVLQQLEPQLDPIFVSNSYGYRPGKSALQAVSEARNNCWKYRWVIDLDIENFFESIDHSLLMRAIKKHTNCRWILLYIERWLKAPTQLQSGELIERHSGTPQGGVISPILANLFLHYALDKWLLRKDCSIKFERYADDIIIHCKTQNKAEKLLGEVESRLKECKLQLHKDKTKIVHCTHTGNYPIQSFDFLGFTFRPRKAITKNARFFTGFLPAVSQHSKKTISRSIRSWQLKRQVHHTIDEVAKWLNYRLRGWYNYFGKFYRSELDRIMVNIERHLRQWVRHKFRKRTGPRSDAWARRYLGNVRKYQPELFFHWKFGLGSPIES